MSALYQTRVSAVGGWNGKVRSDDDVLDLSLSMPKSLGDKGGASNPEQLFAAGYTTCFGNAVIHVTRAEIDKVRDGDIEVVGQDSLNPNGQNGFSLSETMEVNVSSVDQSKAKEIVQAAHTVCPYSNAVKGNIDVQFVVSTRR